MLEIWHPVVLAVLYGAGEAFFGPAFGALVPEIVAPHHLVEANSLDQLVRQACERLLGPAVGGAVVAPIGPGGAFLVDAGTFVVAGLRRDEERHPLLGDAYAGAGAASADSGSGTPAIS